MLRPDVLQGIVTEARAFLKPLMRAELNAYLDFWGEWVGRSLDEIIDMHLAPEHQLETVTREQIMSRLLLSAQNRQSGPRVIHGGLANGWEDLGAMLHGFNPTAILETWDTPEQLFAFFREQHAVGRITGQLAETSRSLWPLFSRSILSAARFLTQYPTADEFVAWLKLFLQSPETAAALPLILAQEIDGFGLALACDFLKELGCTEFPKPDTHVNYLAWELGISTATSDYRMMLDIRRAADSIGMTAYAFDKILWLIGSGRFYRVKVGRYELDVGPQADSFIEHMAALA